MNVFIARGSEIDEILFPWQDPQRTIVWFCVTWHEFIRGSLRRRTLLAFATASNPAGMSALGYRSLARREVVGRRTKRCVKVVIFLSRICRGRWFARSPAAG